MPAPPVRYQWSVKIPKITQLGIFTLRECIRIIHNFVNCGTESPDYVILCPMFTVFVTRTVGASVLQKDFEELEGARAFFDQLLAEKPYDGVMVMLLKREGYARNYLMDAYVIPSTMKLGGNPTGGVGPEQVTDQGTP
jgi:hypothetical protein